MTEETISIPRTTVYMLNVNPGSVASQFTDSLVNLMAADRSFGWGIYQGRLGNISGANVSKSRNELIRKFLDDTDAEWAWFCDSDMVFPPDALVRMLLAAQKVDTQVIGGLCVMVTPSGPIPTIYQYNEHPGAGATRVHLDYPEDSIIQCAATGAAFLMIHRDVLQGMREFADDNLKWLAEHQLEENVQEMIKRHMFYEPSPNYCWFNEMVRRENWVSEDIEFCLRANALGYTVWVDTTLEIGHYKDHRVWMPSDIKKGIGFKKHDVIAVVPVKDKFELTTDIVRQLRKQKCDEIIICDNGSGTKTKNWLSTQDDITLLDCPDVGIHTMWNRAIEHVLDERGHRVHMAFLNNDLKLDDDCLRIMSREMADHPEYVAMSANYDQRPITDSLIQDTEDICAGRYDGTGGLAGFAFMVDGSWFTNGYRFPQECKWWYGDNDLMGSIKYAKRKAGIALAAHVEHLDGGSKTAGDWSDPSWQEQLEKDKKAFEQRWQVFWSQVEARKREANHQCDWTATGDRLPFVCDLEASAKAFPRQWDDDIPYMVKIREDVDRYQRIIEDTQPEVVVECGTWDGGSAEWFASLGLEVITIDIEDHVSDERKAKLNGKVHWLHGNSADREIAEEVKRLVGDRRCLVSLDSDHHACHVHQEMELYNELITPGSYLVVEDGLVRWVPGPEHTTLVRHGPMEAIEAFLVDHPDFERDEELELMYSVTMHPAGWLRKAQP